MARRDYNILRFLLIKERCKRLLPVLQSQVTGLERVKTDHAPVTVSLSSKMWREHAFMDEIETNDNYKNQEKHSVKTEVFKERPKSKRRQGLTTYLK